MKNILVVDDSALMRRVISDIINREEQLHAEWFASNGLEALEILDEGNVVDAIVLDINMPKMNGMEFLREMKRRSDHTKVLIVSTLAREGGAETIEALELGAFDFVNKPTSLAVAREPEFARILTMMLRAATGLSTDGMTEPEDQEEESQTVRAAQVQKARQVFTRTEHILPEGVKGDRSRHTKEPLGKGASKVIALACSTGGPKALQTVIPMLPKNLDAAVMVVQHMPEGFTASLAKRLDELSMIRVKEAEHGEVLEKGTVYIAKGGSQMRLIEKNKRIHTLSVTVEAARNSLKPCADIMYESLMKSSFDEVVCVVMTGMGADGMQGILQLEKTNKIYVIAQDEETCTVYGMPKMITQAEAVDEVVPLESIAMAITKHVGVL